MARQIRFSEIRAKIPERLGIYAIHTKSGRALKVGIGKNLQARLLRHRASLDSALTSKGRHNRANPDNVVSKGSILAKHLYYDESVTRCYDLKTQSGRRNYLEERCRIRFWAPRNPGSDLMKKLRGLERRLEEVGHFRYVGKVRKR